MVSLEEFCRMYARYKSNGDVAECERIYKELTSTEVKALSADEFASQTTCPNEGVSAATKTNRVIQYLTYVTASPNMYDQIYGNLIGYVNNVNNMLGAPNGTYAKLVTTGWSPDANDPNNPNKQIAGEALTNGTFGATCTGPIYVYGVHTDQSGWDNYFVVQVYYAGNWYYVGSAKATTTPTTYPFYPNRPFTNVSVSCVTMPPGTAGTPIQKNSVLIDAVGIDC